MISFKIKQIVLNLHQRREPFYIYDYSKGDYESLNMYLRSTDFSDCYHSSDVEYIWTSVQYIQGDGASSLQQDHLSRHNPPITPVVSNHWTGLLDWNTGMDYWTDIFFGFAHF